MIRQLLKPDIAKTMSVTANLLFICVKPAIKTDHQLQISHLQLFTFSKQTHHEECSHLFL